MGINERLWSIELNLDTIILIALWYLNYHMAFWILLILFIGNAVAIVTQRNKAIIL